MIFDKVRFKNLLSIKELKLTLRNGLYLIDGWNVDQNTANGVGKTSITDGICWILTGKMPRDINIDGIVNWKEGKNCEGELAIKEGKNKYKILRGRLPNKLEFYKNEEKITGKTVKETQILIEKELGINYELFVSSVYFAQNSQQQFVTANDNDKKELLTELLNLEIFDKINEQVKEQIKAKQQELSNIDSGKQVSLKEKEVSQKSLADLEELKKNQENEIIESLKRIGDKVIELKEEESSKQETRLRSREARKKCILEYKAELDENRVKLNLIEGKVEQEEILLKSRIKDRDDKKVEQDKYVDEVNLVKIELSNKMSEAFFNVNNRTSLAQEKVNEIKRIENLGEGVCNNCFQTVSKETLTIQINNLREECLKLIRDKNIHAAEKDRLEKEIIRVEDEKNNKVEGIKSDILKLTNEIQNIEKSIQSSKSDLSSLKVIITRLEGKITSEEKYYQDNEIAIQNSEKELASKISEYDEEIARINNKQDTFSAPIVKAQESIKRMEDVLKNYKIQEEELKKSLLSDEFLKEAFGNRGVKSYVFEQVVNEINSRSNEYLSYLFDAELQVEFRVKNTKNSSGEYNHKFETKVILNGEEKEIGSFSGGERRRIILAVDLAISQIIQNRSSKSVNLLIFDEYFTGLDTIGKEKMMELLKEIENVTILVIDHNTQFQNLFDHEIRLEKRDGITSLL